MEKKGGVKMKHFFSIAILISVFVLGVLFLYSSFVNAENGTKGDPYIINDCMELQNMKNNRSAHYVLGNDIDCSASASWNGGSGFEPIGKDTAKFSGSLNGKGYSISNLTIKRPNDMYNSLLGYVEGPEVVVQNMKIQNIKVLGGAAYVGGLASFTGQYVKVENVEFTGYVEGHDIVGGLIAYARYTTIKNVKINADILGEEAVGGIAGTSSNSTISYSSYEGTLHASTKIGGLVGSNLTNANIDHSFAKGNITSFDGVNAGKIGGLVGYMTNGVLQDNFSTMNVSCVSPCSLDGVGGFVGHIKNGTIERNYSTGLVTSPSVKKGGFLGLYEAGTIKDSYWDTNSSGLSVSNGGIGKTSAEMKQESTYTSWDFLFTWKRDSANTVNNGYPYLLPEDKVPPGEVSILKETHTNTSVQLSWRNPVDLDFDHVNVYRDGVKIGSTTSETYPDSAIVPNATYVYTVKTVDKKGNESSGMAITVMTSDGKYHLFVPTIENFPSTTLTGTKQTITTSFSAPLQIIDNTGSNAEWRLMVQASPFREVAGTGRSMPMHALTLQMPTHITNIDGNTPPSLIDNAPKIIDTEHAVPILHTNAAEGAGENHIIFPINALELTLLPEIAYIDSSDSSKEVSYVSTITFEIVTGP